MESSKNAVIPQAIWNGSSNYIVNPLTPLRVPMWTLSNPKTALNINRTSQMLERKAAIANIHIKRLI